jgi:hypothetical protein
MVIMKMLSNNKGISLVILIVAMTLIAILGASFVSLMGSKQKGFLYQIDSYRALNIANAGVEYAIRHISDSVSDSTTTYFQNLSINDDIGLITFADGSFSAERTFSNTIADDSIKVTARYKNSSRLVKIVRFRRYINTITLVSDPSLSLVNRRPKIGSTINTIEIPILNNDEIAVTISSINLKTNMSGLFLKYVDIDGVAQHLFDYDTCLECPSLSPCKNSLVGGVGLTQDEFKNVPLASLSGSQIAIDSVRKISVVFSSPALNGNYEIEFYSGSNKIGAIMFSI